MNKILILSTARTGTNYFIEGLNKSPETLVYTECLETSLFMMHNKKDELVRKMIGDSKKECKLLRDEDIEELKSLWESSHIKYWNGLWQMYTNRSTKKGIKNIGMKLFPCYLFRSNNVSIDDVLPKFNKFVFIERDPLEIFYSKIKITQLHQKWMDVAIYGTDYRQKIKSYVPTSKGVTEQWLNQWVISWIANDLRFLKQIKKRLPHYSVIPYNEIGNKQISEYCDFKFTDFGNYDKINYDYQDWLDSEPIFKSAYNKLINII